MLKGVKYPNRFCNEPEAFWCQEGLSDEAWKWFCDILCTSCVMQKTPYKDVLIRLPPVHRIDPSSSSVVQDLIR